MESPAVEGTEEGQDRGRPCRQDGAGWGYGEFSYVVRAFDAAYLFA